LPVWNAGVNANEELYFLVCVPDRWDGEHDILVHVTSALLNANEQGHTYQLDMNWEKVTPNIEVVPVAFHSVSAQRYNLSNLQYYCYRDYFVLDYDAPANDPILADDVLALRIRLGSVGGQYVDLDGELLILEVSVLFPRGDLIGEEADMAEAYFLLCFIVLAIGLMIACYAFKKPVLGFAAAGGWLFLGIYSYTLATDGKGIYWSLFFFCMGLMIVSIFEAMGKRGKVERGEDYETDADLKETREQLNALETESKIAREPTSRLRKIIRGNKKKRRPKY